MAEYIERGALMQFPIRRDHYDRENGNEHFINGIETVLEYAENLPAADVAPVVRCKDCMHYDMGVCLKIYSDGNVHTEAWRSSGHTRSGDCGAGLKFWALKKILGRRNRNRSVEQEG